MTPYGPGSLHTASLPWNRCPVCEGRGTVPAGFYSQAPHVLSTVPERCRSCSGKGIVR